jgi:hypothetical protein
MVTLLVSTALADAPLDEGVAVLVAVVAALPEAADPVDL